MKGTETTDFQARFDQLQTSFIDEPRKAVREAGNLVGEAVDRLFRGDHDTEQLRRLMQGYRDLLARIDGHGERAAGQARTERTDEMSMDQRDSSIASRSRDELPERSDGEEVPEKASDAERR